MTRPKRSDAYPPQFLHALRRVAETGDDLIIPTENPIAMRMTFYGLFGALRAENKPDLPGMVSIFILPEKNGIAIRLKDAAPLAQDIAKALGSLETVSPTLPPADDIEATLARILGGETP